MKKILIFLATSVLFLSACSPNIENKDVLESDLEAKMKEIGVTDYKIDKWENDDGKIYAYCSTDKTDLRVYFVEDCVYSISDNSSHEHYYDSGDLFDIYDYETGELSEPAKEIEIPVASSSLIKYSIESRVENTYNDTVIDHVTINNDSIALVYLKWNAKNSAGTTKKMLRMYSDDLAAFEAEEYNELTEIAVFWDVPYLNADLKWHYACKDGKAVMDDSAEYFR